MGMQKAARRCLITSLRDHETIHPIALKHFNRGSILHPKFPRPRPAQFRQISADAEDFPEIAGDGADVGPAAAVDPNLRIRPGVCEQRNIVDPDKSWLGLDILAPSRAVAG